MIRSWKISNFKAVPGLADKSLDLRQLNILVGPNSSGKSTLLQSILMVAQTLRNSSGERPLILNGDLVRLGHATEVVHEGDEKLPLRLSFSLAPSFKDSAGIPARNQEAINVGIELNLPKEGNLGFDLVRASISKGENIGIIAERIPAKTFASEIKYHNNWYIDPILRGQVEKGWFDYNLIRNSSGGNSIELFSLPAERFNPYTSFFHFLPKEVLELYDRDGEFTVTTMRQIADWLVIEKPTALQEGLKGIRFKEKQGRIAVDAIRDSLWKVVESYGKSPQSLRIYSTRDVTSSNTDQILRTLINDIAAYEYLGDWLPVAHQRLMGPTKKKLAQQLRMDAAEIENKSRYKSSRQEGSIGVRSNAMPADIVGISQQVILFFTERLRYLGPLRDDPRAIYGIPINPETKDVGMKGEYTAAVLERYKEEIVDLPLPPSSGQPLGKTRPCELREAISEWLKYMDLVEEVTTHDLGKIGYELKVRSRGVEKELDLTNVGVGVSQVLPTLVTALLTPLDSLLLLEQPELHLHPKVQSRLGDFILCVALAGKQCIVETHSEYLVNRIRRRIAESEGRTILDRTSLYFVERGLMGAEFTRVEPNEYGAVLKWPKGFFDEGPEEAQLIMEAAMKKRKANQNIR